MPKAKIITGLDIGTSSIKVLSCLKKPNSQNLEVLAGIQLPSFGVRKGVIVDIDEVSKNIVAALSRLQEETNQKIDNVYINISGGHIFSTPSHGTVAVSRADQKISEEDVNRVVQAAQAFSLPPNKEVLEVFPREFIVDGHGQIKKPQGMQGLRLEVDVLALCVFSPYLNNLTAAVLAAGYQISDIIPSFLASSRAVLTPQQKELGVCLLDIGAGTTDLVIYEEGDLIHAAVFPVGSAHITYDIAVGLKTDVDIAEQVKKEFGTCLFKGSDKKEKIESVKDSENGEPLSFSRKMLVKIIEARVLEIFDLTQKELKKISSKGLLPGGVILTGGGAKLPKIVDMAKKVLKLPVKLGVPQDIEGLEKDPCWSTASGLVLRGVDLQNDREGPRAVLDKGITGKLKKLLKAFIP